jgi:hypothetical protein
MMRALTMLCLTALAQATAAPNPSIQQRFIGSWKLISYQFTSANGEVTYPRGRDAVGRITYDQTGRMSVQIMQPGRPNFAGIDPLKATPEEMVTAYRGYVAYYGTYTVDESRGVVIHKVEGSLYPNYVATEQVRRYTFSTNRLTLEAETQLGRAKLVWERLP